MLLADPKFKSSPEDIKIHSKTTKSKDDKQYNPKDSVSNSQMNRNDENIIVETSDHNDTNDIPSNFNIVPEIFNTTVELND